MESKELLTKKFIMVGMDEIKISTDDKLIIGTDSLATCVAFILHNKEQQKTIVGHLSTDTLINEQGIINFIIYLNKIIKENELTNTNFDLHLIKGAIPSQTTIYSDDLIMLKSFESKKYSTLEVLEEILKRIRTINIKNINKTKFPNNAFQIVDEYGNLESYVKNPTLSKQFAFDSKTGTFVTDKVLFGIDYLNINKGRGLK